MNPQYMQQQRPVYGPPPSNAPYGELNANLSPKGPHELGSLPPQKPLQSQPPTIDAACATKPPYYVNDIQGQVVDTQHGPPLPPQSNQTNLVNQMSNVTLSGIQKPSQDFSPQSEKNVPNMPFSSTVNGINNQNHYIAQGEPDKINFPGEKSGLISQKSSPHQPGSADSQIPSLPNPYGSAVKPQISEQQQYPGQMPPFGSPSVRNTSGNPVQMTPAIPTEHHGQLSSQNRYNAPLVNQGDLMGPAVTGKSIGVIPNSPNTGSQQSFRAPPLLNQPHGTPLNPPPLGPQTLSNRKNTPDSSLPGPISVAPPALNQNLPGPPLPGQNLQAPSFTDQQGLQRSPLGQTSNLSGQQQLSGPYGQQNLSGPPLLPVQQTHSPYPYSNQVLEQRRYTTSPSLSGPQNVTNSYTHTNYQHSEINYQGYQKQNCSQSGQTNMYANQMNPYQSGISSTPEGYQTNVQSQQVRRLDPNQMPSPIQLIQDDQRLKGGVFVTNEKGLVPPLVTTKFTVEDKGNASPRFIRSTIYTVPTATDIIKQTHIPFSLILSPMAQIEEGEFEPPIVDMGEIGPVRCNRCKAYMSPFMQFIDAGRRFQCMFCKTTTEVPLEYFQHLDQTGQRMDRYERPELILGTYEFLATKEYCTNKTFPNPPAIIFVIDVSYNTVKSGLINLICANMKKIIRHTPVDVGQSKSNMKIGFITYSSTVQFYNIKANLAQPQMMVVGDVQDVFMPLLDGFLCNPEESEALIDSLMTQIPVMFGDSRETETILGPAIQAGLEALKASSCAGKLMVFHSSLPIANAPGKLKNRDDRKLLGTDKEKNVLTPQINYYNNLGQDCVASGCSVDLFIFNNSYIDVATIGQVCRLTGGEVYKYTYFQADIDGERLITDIINNISRPIAFDAVMRVRTSTGVRPTEFFGHFYMSHTTDVELASIDCDKAVAIEIKHDDKLAEDEGVYIQAALLYTSCSGIRRLRIINLSLKTSSQIAELFKSCDLDAIINFLSKQSVFKLMDSSLKAVKDNLISRCATILASYRRFCSSPSSIGQLVLPECMKLLPLYINGLLKSDAITGGSGITIDQKSYVIMSVTTMPIGESVVHVYPRLISLHDVNPQSTDIPPMLRCSKDKFTDDGAYLLENGIHMFLWLGANLSSQWLQSVFGVSSVLQVDTDKTTIPPLNNPLNDRIRYIISYVQSERRHCMRLTITRQREKMEMVMRQFLVEDPGVDGSLGYVDFLCHIHREIRTLLS
ncbi:PREDICTED: protein transport protein Sec24C isoform X2 [Ceratosolen solmsi marchali]|nr:PREDICTED: protein transport protein Sec24C isoform X2 [Ceratosolen solmsi marchali]XP_011498374.1 PREDICTED: protein transport protein Sec24C isoform X2 [Ceratosolen solmsi marchali]